MFHNTLHSREWKHERRVLSRYILSLGLISYQKMHANNFRDCIFAYAKMCPLLLAKKNFHIIKGSSPSSKWIVDLRFPWIDLF